MVKQKNLKIEYSASLVKPPNFAKLKIREVIY